MDHYKAQVRAVSTLIQTLTIWYALSLNISISYIDNYLKFQLSKCFLSPSPDM